MTSSSDQPADTGATSWIPIEDLRGSGAGLETQSGRFSDQLRDKRLYVAGHISCPSSRVYLNGYEEFILHHGAMRCDNAGEADIVLVDTCAFSAQQEQESLGLTEKARESRSRKRR